MGLGGCFKVVDKTGAVLIKCLSIISPLRNRKVGTKFIGVVKKAKPYVRGLKKKRVIKGDLVKGVVVKSTLNISRSFGYFIKFSYTGVVVLKRDDDSPFSNRITSSVSSDLRFLPGFSKILSISTDVF